jgi:regulatory Fis family protein
MEEGHFETLEDAVRRHIMDALMLAGGNQRQAAALLGVTRWKLARMITRFDLRDFVNGIRSVDQQTSVAQEAAPEALTSGSHDR